MTTRREFLKNSALVTAASAAGAIGAPRFAFGQAAGGKTLIKVFMRGGADGLHLMPAVGDLTYYQYRPQIAIEPPSGNDGNSAINIGDSLRALNPNLEPLMEIWDAGRLTLSPCTALDEGNRSHFDCQRWIGTGAQNDFIDGYLNRYLQEASSSTDSLRGMVAGKTSLSTDIRGAITVPVIQRGESFELESNPFCSGSGCADNQLTEMIRRIASHEVDQSAAENGIKDNQLILVDSLDRVQAAANGYQTSAGGLEYSDSSLGRGLKLVAQLLKAGIPLEVAALDWNIGWDTHKNQIATTSDHVSSQDFTYNRRMREGATDFLTFYRDISGLIDNVAVVCGSEFGRTVQENGSFGTDHGHGGCWFSFGGPSTSLVAPDVSTVDIDTNGMGNRLPTVVNYRDMVAELMVRHMGMAEGLVSTVFPNHTFNDLGLYGSSAASQGTVVASGVAATGAMNVTVGALGTSGSFRAGDETIAWDFTGGDWTEYSGRTFTSPVSETNYGGNGAKKRIFRNCTFRDINGDGFKFGRGVEDIWLINCSFSNIRNGSAVAGRSSSGSNRVHIVGCTVDGVDEDGISVSDVTGGPDHENCFVVGNDVQNTGRDGPNGLLHSIYVQAPDIKVIGNHVHGSRDDAAISCRSSAIITDNLIEGPAMWQGGRGIRYYADHPAGPSDTWSVKRNHVQDSNDPIFISNPPGQYQGNSSHLVNNFVVQNNTCDRSNILVEGSFWSGYSGYNLTASNNRQVSDGNQNA